MNWKASPPAIEIAVVTLAAACLGGAAGFAVAQMAPFGTGLFEAGGTGVAVALAAWLFLWRVDGQRGVRQPFARESLGDLLIADDVLLLDQRVDDDDTLLLDDPLPALGEDSRVVRLFAAQPVASETPPTPLAGPGEMIARIEDFLGHARDGAAAAPLRRGDRAAADEASAALHAALADIRRSLRQG